MKFGGWHVSPHVHQWIITYANGEWIITNKRKFEPTAATAPALVPVTVRLANQKNAPVLLNLKLGDYSTTFEQPPWTRDNKLNGKAWTVRGRCQGSCRLN